MTVFKATFERFNFTFDKPLKESVDVVFEVQGPGAVQLMIDAKKALKRQCPHWEDRTGPKLYLFSQPKDWSEPQLANSHIVEVKLSMNGFVCFWNGKRAEVHAGTRLEAQEKARQEFQKGTRKKVKGYDVTVVLAEKDGEQVVHDTVNLGQL